MNKKKAIKLVTASALAASSFAAVAPFNTEAAVNVASSVTKATTQMAKVKDIYTNGKVLSSAAAQKEVTNAKKYYADAKAVVTKYAGSKKSLYLGKLSAALPNYTSAQNYITGVKYAEGVKAQAAKLEAAGIKGDINTVKSSFPAFSTELAKAEGKIKGYVASKTAQTAVIKAFLTSPKAIAPTLNAYVYAEKAAYWTNASDFKTADLRLTTAQSELKKGSVTTALGKAVSAYVQQVKAQYDQMLPAAVASVSAINAKELVVSFNKAVDATDATDLTKYSVEGVTFGGTPVVSEDGKTVTLTAVGTLALLNAKVTVQPIKTKADTTIKTAEYNALLTYADTIAPVVTSVKAVDKTAVITFAEELASEGTISLNGVALVKNTDYTVSGKTVTIIKGIEAEKSYRVDIVGAKDVANNTANPIVLNFTSQKPVVDTVKPTVSTSVNGTIVTVKFSEELAKQDLNDTDTNPATGVDEYAVVTVGTTPYLLTDAQKDSQDKTKFTFDAKDVLGTNAFVNTTVKVESFKDVAGNAGDAATTNATLQADKTAPTLVSYSSKMLVADDTNATTDTDVVYLTFSEPVTVTGDFSLVSKNGILYDNSKVTLAGVKSGLTDIDGNGKIEGSELNTVAVPVDLDKNSNYVFELAANAVTDNATNKISNAIKVSFTSGDYQAAATQSKATLALASSPVVDATKNNVFTVTYNADVTSSALNAANYTLGGAALPVGTTLQFLNGTKTVMVTLPVGSIVANGSYALEIKNVVDTTGNTLVGGKASDFVSLKESVAPTASKITVVDSKTFTVDFSEVVANNATVTGVTVKVNGAVVTPKTVSAANGKLTVTTNADVALTDSISVEFKSANLVDANNNKVVDGVVSK